MGESDKENKDFSGKKTMSVLQGRTSQQIELSWWKKGLYVIYFIVLFFLLMYVLLKFWPLSPPASENETVPVIQSVHLFSRLQLAITEEMRLMIIVAVMGALGGCAYSIKAFVYRVGNRNFDTSWTCWYALRPFIGSILAIIFYFAFRAAFFSLSASTEDLNNYGIATLGGIVGLYSWETMKKLEDLFERILPTDREEQEPGGEDQK
jgi:magnesium-transporting ATPase (P-type)